VNGRTDTQPVATALLSTLRKFCAYANLNICISNCDVIRKLEASCVEKLLLYVTGSHCGGLGSTGEFRCKVNKPQFRASKINEICSVILII
jgi:hypothetical protein